MGSPIAIGTLMEEKGTPTETDGRSNSSEDKGEGRVPSLSLLLHILLPDEWNDLGLVVLQKFMMHIYQQNSTSSRLE